LDQKTRNKAQGKREYVDYLETRKKLSPIKAIKAHCYQWQDCPLYPYMPYHKDAVKTKRARSEKQIEHDKNLSILRSGAKKTMIGKI
jgi:hypothetical protein